jgi:hypothetical protein
MMDDFKPSRWFRKALVLTFVVSALAKLVLIRALIDHLR